MIPQPRFEPGERLIVQVIRPSSIQVVMYAAAMWEYQRIHFDQGWAEREGLPGPIVHGPLLGNYLVQAVQRSYEDQADLVLLEWRNRGIAPIGELLTVGGVVSGIHSDDPALVTCELWIKSAAGESIVTATATIRRKPSSFEEHSA